MISKIEKNKAPEKPKPESRGEQATRDRNVIKLIVMEKFQAAVCPPLAPACQPDRIVSAGEDCSQNTARICRAQHTPNQIFLGKMCFLPAGRQVSPLKRG